LSVDSATQVTLSLPAAVSATSPLVLAPYGVGDGSTTFGIPNRAYLAVGRDNARGSASSVMQVLSNSSLTLGSNVVAVSSSVGLYIGMFVSHPKLPIPTTITGISGTNVTVSNLATATVLGTTVRFSPLLDAQTPGAVGGALSQSTTIVTANLPAYTPSGAVGTSTPGWMACKPAVAL
jgi:hypothetical protein